MAELAGLLQPVNIEDARRAAIRHLQQSTGSVHATPAKLANLESFLVAEQAKQRALESELAHSDAQVQELLLSTRKELSDVMEQAMQLKERHEQVSDELIDHREALFAGLSAQSDQMTLRDHLELLSNKRRSLEQARDWFNAVSKAEELGTVCLRFLQAARLSDAFGSYVELVSYTARFSQDPRQGLARQLVSMTRSVWSHLVRHMSQTLLQKLEKIGWPTPFKERLDWYDAPAREFRTAFLEMLELEKLNDEHPIPTLGKQKAKAEVKPLLALVPFVHPLLLRFKWHFEGTRTTNRIDKPEYPLSHVLNLIEAHERFMEEDIQALLDDNGFAHIDAMTDFTTLLLPPLVNRLRFHIPQLLTVPPVLAHTIYQTLEFDRMLKARDYKPRGTEGDWQGLSAVILSQKEWFDRWLLSEREFFDKRYYAAISAADAWHILPPEEYDASETRSGIRPTKSALRIAELAEQLSDRYRPLPSHYATPFLLSLHLPLLDSYAGRIASSFAAFESLTLGSILPGGLSEGAGRAATGGTGGLQRLLRSTVSARWMSDKCSEWGEDAHFLSLFAFLADNPVPSELVDARRALLESATDGTVFDKQRSDFAKQADRGEDLVIKHVVRETLHELKAYLAKKWDAVELEQDAASLSLSPELNTPLASMSSMLSAIMRSLPLALATTVYRRIATALSTALYERLLISRTWSEAGARQFLYDLENGFLFSAKEAGVQRGVARGWDLALGGARIVALPASGSTSAKSEASMYSFAQVMQVAFDDAVPEGEGTQFGEMMESLGVPESIGKREVKLLMRRRPECWR